MIDLDIYVTKVHLLFLFIQLFRTLGLTVLELKSWNSRMMDDLPESHLSESHLQYCVSDVKTRRKVMW